MLGWLLATRLYVVVALLWLLIPMLWRLTSALYIDMAGPVLAEEVMRHLGPGHGAALLALDYAAVLGAFALVLPPGLLERRSRPELPQGLEEQGPRLARLAFVLACGFLAAAYVDLLRIGSIPLFSGIERYDYARDYAGHVHRLLFRFGDV